MKALNRNIPRSPRKRRSLVVPLPLAPRKFEYGPLYSVKNVRRRKIATSERTIGKRRASDPLPSLRRSSALNGPLTIWNIPRPRSMWLGLSRMSLPTSTPNAVCHAVSAIPPTAKTATPTAETR